MHTLVIAILAIEVDDALRGHYADIPQYVHSSAGENIMYRIFGKVLTAFDLLLLLHNPDR